MNRAVGCQTEDAPNDRSAQTSVTSWTAGRWSGSIRLFNDLVEQPLKSRQIVQGNYNAGAHDGYWGERAISKQRGGIWANMRERQRGKIAGYGHIELPVAQNFRNVVRVYYRRWLSLF